MRENMRKSIHMRLLFTLASQSNMLLQESFVPVSYTTLYWVLQDYQPSTVRAALSSLLEEHAISQYKKDGLMWVELTSVGRVLLTRFIPVLEAKKKKWDGQWSVVLLAETARAFSGYRKLRELLQRERYVALQRGVYLSYESLPSFLEKEVGNHVVAFRSQQVGDNVVLARELWKLELLSKQYAKLSSHIRKLLILAKKKRRLNNRDKLHISNAFIRVYEHYCEDPGIPTQLLPPIWPFSEQYRVFVELAKIALQQ